MAEAPLSLLVVEDDAVDRMAVVRALRGLAQEYQVAEAATLAEARASIASASYDCVVTDLRLPDGEAAELLEALRREDGFLSAPVIVVTGLEDEELAQRFVKGGAQDYLHKSDLNPRTLTRSIRHAIQRHGMVTELQRRDQLLRQGQRMESISKLAGGIAHDFNNMLTVIGGFTSVALMKLGDHPAAKDLEAVVKATERLAELTTEILAFASNQDLEPETLELRELVDQTEPLLSRVLGASVELSFGGAGRGEVSVDRGSFQQVLLNLAMNAADAMPEGGLLDLSVEDVVLASDEVPGLPAGPYLRLAARDSGVGMTSEVAAQVFEPFFTTKRFGAATGLGLATVHGIIKQSAGAITLESAPGKGTTFWIWLPRVDAPPPKTQELRPSEVLRRGARTIMIAEDEPLVRTLLRDALSEAGYRVVTAVDGAQALNLVRRREVPIDLLISDIDMPALDGIELAAAVETESPETSIVLISGRLDAESRRRLQERHHFFAKPVSPTQIVNAAQTLIGASTPGGRLTPWN